MERLQKFIAKCNYCSRRKAEELILAGHVKVNGSVITTLGFKVEESDEVSIDGEVLKVVNKVTYLLNKPKNIISSAFDDRGRKTVADLIDCEYRLYPIGRLDFDSSGLLLMSNDGELTNMLIHPRFHIPKVYEVTVEGLIKPEEIAKLEEGVWIDDIKCQKCEIRLLGQTKHKSFMEVTIYEGRNRQIRKMFKTLDYEVTRLHRIREANIELGNLKSGEYRLLKPYEIKKLREYLNSHDD